MKPRLQEHYEQTVRPMLAKEFGFQNVHQIPRLEKVIVNVGVGEASRDPKLLDSVVEAISAIAGQRPIGSSWIGSSTLRCRGYATSEVCRCDPLTVAVTTPSAYASR